MKKLEPNGLWQTKFILPEHSEALKEQNHELKLLSMPTLDEQEINLINGAIRSSLIHKRIIILTLYSQYELRSVIGTVLMLLDQLKQVKILLWNPFAIEDECVWISLTKVIKAELKEAEDWNRDEEFLDW